MLPRLRSLMSFADHLLFDAARLDRRLRQRLTLGEVFAILLAIGFLGIFTNMVIQDQYEPNDYGIYLDAANGDRWGFFYADWIIPVYIVLGWLPESLGFALHGLLTILGVWFATRVFRGPAPPALLNYQLLYVLFYGNIVGIIVGALALAWWSMVHKRWYLAGLALLIACTKYQLGGPLALALWLLADCSWRDRARMLIVPAAAGLLSLIIYPLWPLHMINRVLDGTLADWGSISLWQWIGPLALLLWVPVVWLPLSPTRRLIAITVALTLSSPYFQQTDLLALFMLPTGALAWLGNLGILFIWGQWAALRVLALIPVIAYLIVIGPPLRAWIDQRRTRESAQPSDTN